MELTMSEQKVAIRVENVDKIYKLYNRPSDRLRDAFSLLGKKRYKEKYALKMNLNQG